MVAEMTHAKDEIRQRALDARKAISTEIRDQAACVVAKRLWSYLQNNPHKVIAGYWPMGSELNLIPTLEFLIKQGVTVGLPTCTPGHHELIFKPWKSGDPLSTTSFGFLGPSELSEDGPLDPDLFLVPALAFDRQGVRLGRGKGHYDRVLHEARAKKNVTIIGIAFAIQEYDVIPEESHDERLDFIITEKEWIDVKAARAEAP